MLTVTLFAYKKLCEKLSIDSFAYDSNITFNFISSKENKKRFRIKVMSGGCSGFQYKFSIDNSLYDEDMIFASEKGLLEIVVDKHSMPFLQNVILNHEQSLAGQHFVIQNPNAKQKCSCGNSFNL